MPKNLYADLGMFRRRFVNSSTLDADDATEIERAIEAASRRADEFCHRVFFAATDTRYFDGDGCGEVWIPDLLSATSIKLDEDGDRTYEITLSAGTDYILERPGADDADGPPATRLRLDAVNGRRSAFVERERLIEIAGRWGYTQATEVVAGGSLAEDLDTSETGVDVASGAAYQVGQTILIGSEQMYVEAIAGNTLTVKRGVNGTTAASAANGAAVARYVYVPEVAEAALIMAGRLWTRRKTSYASVVANETIGQFAVARGMSVDPDVIELLAPLVRTDRLV